jgi:glycerate kinase
MKVVVAPNALKGSLAAPDAAAAVGRGVRAAAPDAEVVEIPVSDGGDGFASVMAVALGGRMRVETVTGPRFEPIDASYCLVHSKQIAGVEMALASGLALLDEPRRDPEETTTYGTGELIGRAVEAGARHIVVGIGGSATNDGGIGMASALGVRFLDRDGLEIHPAGGELGRIRRIDISGLSDSVKEVGFEVICDVHNPLLGDRGAARVYGPQKGATPEQVERLEAGLANLADCIERDLGVDIRDLPGAGAAGGLGAGLRAFLGAELRPGVDVVLETVGLAPALEGAAVVFTAEGALDEQTAYGKAPAGVASRAKERGIPCIALGGGVSDDLTSLHAAGVTAALSICPRPVSLDEAVASAEAWLAASAEEAMRVFLAGR